MLQYSLFNNGGSVKRPTELFPEIEPYKSGMIYSDDDQPIYYEECGNPEGKPLLHLHGGPGSGCSPRDRQWPDPKKWRHILFDQRDCGRSRIKKKPPSESAQIIQRLFSNSPMNLDKNTTKNLVSDIRKILKELGIDKTAIWGASWGAFLGLAYAIEHPETVSGMLLSRIFLGEKEEIDYLFNGSIANHHPEIWNYFIGYVPAEYRSDPVSYYYWQLSSPGLQRRRYFAEIWVNYEASLLSFDPNPKQLPPQSAEEAYTFYETLAQIEAHYFKNNCFVEDKFIIKNASRIPQVPIILVHGRYDMLCPLKKAYELYQNLPQSDGLYVVRAGHSSNDSEILKMLASKTDELYDMI